MAAFAAGDTETAFDTCMRGVCGESYRDVRAQRLESAGLDRAVRESAFFFRDEVPAVLESQFGEAAASRVQQPILVAEGGESARLGLLSQQITALAREAPASCADRHGGRDEPHDALQDPDAVGRLIPTFVTRHASRA